MKNWYSLAFVGWVLLKWFKKFVVDERVALYSLLQNLQTASTLFEFFSICFTVKYFPFNINGIFRCSCSSSASRFLVSMLRVRTPMSVFSESIIYKLYSHDCQNWYYHNLHHEEAAFLALFVVAKSLGSEEFPAPKNNLCWFMQLFENIQHYTRNSSLKDSDNTIFENNCFNILGKELF